MTPIQEQLSQLEKLNFTGKGEALATVTVEPVGL